MSNHLKTVNDILSPSEMHDFDKRISDMQMKGFTLRQQAEDFEERRNDFSIPQRVMTGVPMKRITREIAELIESMEEPTDVPPDTNDLAGQYMYMKGVIKEYGFTDIDIPAAKDFMTIWSVREQVFIEIQKRIDALDEKASQSTEQGFDAIRPEHYGGEANPYEPIKVISAWQLGFNLGNSVKYIARCEKKGAALLDLKKALQYLQWEIAKRENEKV